MVRTRWTPGTASIRGVFLLSGLVQATWLARVPAIQEGAGLGPTELGIALFAQFGGAFLGLYPAAVIGAWIGARPMLLGAWSLYAGALVLLPHAPNLAVLAPILALKGAANSGLDVGANAEATRVEEARGRPMMSGFHAFHSMGMLMGAGLAAGAAALGIGAQLHFTAVGGVLLPLGLGLCWMAVRPLPTPPPVLALPSRSLLLPAALLFAIVFIDDVANGWSAVYLRQVSGAAPGIAALGFGAFAGGTLLGRLVADRIVARLGRSRFLQLAAALTAAGMLLGIAAPSPVPALAAFGLLGLGVAGVFPVILGYAANEQPQARAHAIAAVSTVGYLGSVVSPLVIGPLADVAGLRAAMIVLPVLAVAAAIGARRL